MMMMMMIHIPPIYKNTNLQAEKLLDRGIHPLRVAEGYEAACKVAIANLEKIAASFEFSKDNLEPLVQTCMTTLSSKM